MSKELEKRNLATVEEFDLSIKTSPKFNRNRRRTSIFSRNATLPLEKTRDVGTAETEVNSASV